MTYPNSTHYSEHFSKREMNCRCGCKTPPDVERNIIEHCKELEKLRLILGVPMHVHCCYRCTKHNAAIGGAPNSQHRYGRATDFSTKKYRPEDLASLAEGVPAFANGGIHAYWWGTHVDNRGYKARW